MLKRFLRSEAVIPVERRLAKPYMLDGMYLLFPIDLKRN